MPGVASRSDAGDEAEAFEENVGAWGFGFAGGHDGVFFFFFFFFFFLIKSFLH